MTIGKSSRKSLKSPKYLDRSSGFYGRLDEPEQENGNGQEAEEQGRADGRIDGREMHTQATQGDDKRESGIFDFNQGMLEDDGTATLLRKTPARRSSRWRRKSGSKKKRVEAEPEDPAPAGESVPPTMAAETMAVDSTASQTQDNGHILVHFSVREEADDQVLISQKAERETEVQRGEEEIKVAKRGKLKSYRKALDRALRRGWETFVSNLYSVTLTPVSSTETSPSSSSQAGVLRGSAIVEYR
ncbi:hypothetical protein ANANG_G00057020 [Anguilla anguilla]|uniref:Uncharacterized protein n=1 Tax=Anguilla anguilla TaxID=7936 RepID=A0A9D3MN40_ANGAN|nr:hypothetical protein ANANG_G00057020 [Anguilla anguilla]